MDSYVMVGLKLLGSLAMLMYGMRDQVVIQA